MLYIIGMGPGDRKYLTNQAEECIRKAVKVYGYPKHLEIMEIAPEKQIAIRGALEELPGKLLSDAPEEKRALLVSGDPSVFSLTRRITAELPSGSWTIVPGLGSYQILATALNLSTPLPRRISLHGHGIQRLTEGLLRREPLMVYTDSTNTPAAIASFLCSRGLKEWLITVGENLGNEKQKITSEKAEDLAERGSPWELNLCYIAPPPLQAKGKLYGIGLGPGDPELITLKALRTIKNCDLILCPKSRVRENSLALQILQELTGGEVPFWEIEYPTVTDKDELALKWEEHANMIARELKEQKRVGFITLGDPGIYSTFIYLLYTIQARHPGTDWEIIPGISSIQLASARSGIPLVIGKENCVVAPVPEKMEDLIPLLEQNESLILMKVGRRLSALKSFLEKQGLNRQAALIKRAGLKDEEIYRTLDEIPDGYSGNLSVVLIRKGKIL